MSDANSILETNVTDPASQQGEPDKSAVQKRIDELTAEKYAKDEQIKQLTNQVTDMVGKFAQMQQVPRQPEAPNVPEGIDPALAKFFMEREEKLAKTLQANTERLFWQVQHQQDQLAVNNKYAHLPEEVRQDAARRLTGMKQRYGEAATLDDAMTFAEHAWMKKQMQSGQAARYNQMNPPMNVQSGMPNIGGPQAQPTGLVPPTARADWNALDLDTQNKLITEYEKKGGSLF